MAKTSIALKAEMDMEDTFVGGPTKRTTAKTSTHNEVMGITRERFSILRPLTAAEFARADRIGHFYGIDLMRSLAALTILVWHYQHFYMTAGVGFREESANIDRTVQPFYSLLFPLYEYGFWAVQAFWAISGFVFAMSTRGGKHLRPPSLALDSRASIPST
jgi:hypothetical protein